MYQQQEEVVLLILYIIQSPFLVLILPPSTQLTALLLVLVLISDTVIAPVESTVQYTCEYVDMKGGLDVPYWYIAELSDIPFLQGEGDDQNLTIKSVISETGYTIIRIPVKEQYLNNTLTRIQCGLCSAKDVCYNPNVNRLSENIISSAVIELVTLVSTVLLL